MPRIEKDSLDRGRQHYTFVPEAVGLGIVPEGTKKLTDQQLKDTFIRKATERMDSPHIQAFEGAVESIKENGEHGRILEQISQIGVLNQIVVPATPEIIEQMGRAATQTFQTRGGDEELKDLLADRFASYLQANFASSEDKSIAILALRALRNYPVIADDVLRQLLWRIQTTAIISFEGLRGLFQRTSLKLNGMAEMKVITNELARAGLFIEAAEEGIKRRKLVETPQDVEKRAPALLKVMALLAQEYIAQYGNDKQTANFVARHLVRAFFAHQIHWVHPKDKVLQLCSEIAHPKISLDQPVDSTNVISQFLLEAQLWGLIDSPLSQGEEAVDKKDYLTLNLTDRIFKEHQEKIRRHQRQVVYTPDFRPSIPKEARVVTILGYYNLPHLGYVSLIGATEDVFRHSLSTEQPWKIVISVNQKDPTREVGGLENGRPPAFPQEIRIPMALVNFGGFIGDRIILTSIEDIVGHPNDVPARLKALKQVIEGSGGEVARASGFDKHGLGQPWMKHLVLGLRGLDLLNILRQPHLIEEIKQRLPDSKIDLALLPGVTTHSSSRAWRIATKFLTEGDMRRYYELQAMVHRGNTKAILNTARGELEKRGKTITPEALSLIS